MVQKSDPAGLTVDEMLLYHTSQIKIGCIHAASASGSSLCMNFRLRKLNMLCRKK